jgi:hypothetical protein
MKKFFAGAGMALLAISSLHAQSSGNGVGDFTLERVLALSGVISPFAPNLPDAVLAGIQSGALEIHQLCTYNSAQRTLDELAFVVPGKSPLPFPNPSAAPVADHYVIQVDSASISSLPGPAVILAGHVTSNDTPTPFGDITGAGVTFTFGYRGSGSSVQYGPIMESVSPLYNLYSVTGAGSLSLTPAAQTCNMATLNGTYMFRLGGSQQAGLAFGPYWETGVFIADGKGGVTIEDSGNFQGTPFSGRVFPGNYTVDATCRGSITFSGGAMDIQVSRDGQRMNMVFTKPSTIVANGVGQIQ